MKVEENISPGKKIRVTVDDKEQLNRLTRAIEISDKYFLFLASCNQVPRENELVARLKKKLAGRKIQIVNFDKPIENLLGELQKNLKKKKFDAVFVTGLRRSVPSNVKAKDNAFIANLNVTRDAFPPLLSCPLVLWLPEYAIGKLMNGAPDFFSVRSGIFFFDSDLELIAQQILEEISGKNNDYDALRFEERGQKIRNLEELLGEYRSLPDEKRDLRTENEIKDRLANLYYITARYEEAEKLRTDLLNGAIQQGNNEEIARFYNELASVYKAQGRYNEAIEKYEEALRIGEKTVGREHPAYAIRLNNLALVYEEQGRYDEAIEKLEEALRIDEKTIGVEHPDYAIDLTNLANIYRAQGRYDEAIQKLEEALRIDEKTIGCEHPGYAIDLNNLASVYIEQGRYDEAIEKYEEALRIAEKTIGPEHPDYAVRLNNMANVYADQGRYDEAIEKYQDAIRIDEKTIGREHPNYAVHLNNVAGVRLLRGDIKKALELFEEALSIFEKAFPKNHPHILNTRKRVEMCRKRLGQ